MPSSSPLPPFPFLQKGNPKVVFVHIPKTAGTSIHRAIGGNPIDKKMRMKKHYSASEICELIGKKGWEQAFKFAFVRNPWDRLLSQYRFRLRKGRIKEEKFRKSFKLWVYQELVMGRDALRNRPNLRPQVDWLKGPTGKIELDFVGRFESLGTDFLSVKQHLGLEGGLPHLEKGEEIDYQTVYDQETATWVADYYSADIAEWGYQTFKNEGFLLW